MSSTVNSVVYRPSTVVSLITNKLNTTADHTINESHTITNLIVNKPGNVANFIMRKLHIPVDCTVFRKLHTEYSRKSVCRIAYFDDTALTHKNGSKYCQVQWNPSVLATFGSIQSCPTYTGGQLKRIPPDTMKNELCTITCVNEQVRVQWQVVGSKSTYIIL
jgi:hypothetical protein